MANESLFEGVSDFRDATKFAHRFSNRTFKLPTGSVYFDQRGDRLPDIILRQLNPVSAAIEVTEAGCYT